MSEGPNPWEASSAQTAPRRPTPTNLHPELRFLVAIFQAVSGFWYALMVFFVVGMGLKTDDFVDGELRSSWSPSAEELFMMLLACSPVMGIVLARWASAWVLLRPMRGFLTPLAAVMALIGVVQLVLPLASASEGDAGGIGCCLSVVDLDLLTVWLLWQLKSVAASAAP